MKLPIGCIFVIQWNKDFMLLKEQFKMKVQLKKFMQLLKLNTVYYYFLALKM